jgi:hypothetical protein
VAEAIKIFGVLAWKKKTKLVWPQPQIEDFDIFMRGRFINRINYDKKGIYIKVL